MTEALWPGGLVILIGAVVIAVALIAWRRRSFQQLQEEFMLGNEDTGILIEAQRPGWEPPPPPEPEPESEPITDPEPTEYLCTVEEWIWFDTMSILPPPLSQAALRAPMERMASTEQLLSVQLATMRIQLREESQRALERMRWEHEDEMARFDRDMDWDQLLEYAHRTDAARLQRVLNPR